MNSEGRNACAKDDAFPHAFFFFSFSETGLEGAEPVAEPVSGQGKKGT